MQILKACVQQVALLQAWQDQLTSTKYKAKHWFGRTQQHRTLVLTFN